MALIIRLRQQGKNNQRSFRLVVADERSPRDGKYLEKLGYYDPRFEDKLEVDTERVKHWLDHGALISERAEILVSKKAPEVIKQYKENKCSKKLKLLKKKKEAKKTASSK
jgi:small subunit ribosomal protein S16